LYIFLLGSPSLAPLRGLSRQQVIQLEQAGQQRVLEAGKAGNEVEGREHENWDRQKAD
jgi:hypothetical protein